MSDTKNAHEGVVTSIADTDLVMVVGPQGGLHPVSFANFMKAVRGGIQTGGRNLVSRSADFRGLANDGTYKGFGVYTGQAWTHPSMTLTEPLEQGETVTLSFYLKGSVAYWSPVGYIYGSESEWRRVVITLTLDESCESIQVVRPSSHDNTGITSICGIKLERGNIATDWSPAPEDIASGSWGGVIGYLPITYNSTAEESEKGGAHERHEDACGQAEISADSHLAFGSLDAVCRFIGESVEICIDEREYQRSRSDICFWSLACSGLFQNRHDKSKLKCCHQGFDTDAAVSNIQEQSKFDTQPDWYRSLILRFRHTGSGVCRNETVSGFRIADRKEVAYGD